MTPHQAALVLKIKRPWTEEEVKRAYKTASKRTHPDHKGGSDAAFKNIATAKASLDEYFKEVKEDQIPPHVWGADPARQAPPPPPPMAGRRRRNTRGPPQPPPRQSNWRAQHGTGWYNTGDARSRAAGQDPYFRGRQRVDPQAAYHAEAQARAEEEDEGTAQAGDNYIIRSLIIGQLQINISNVTAQLQHINGQYAIAIYFKKALPVASGRITIILAEDKKDPGSLLQNREITSRSYNPKGWVTVLWFSPF